MQDRPSAGAASGDDEWDYPPHTQAKHAILARYLDAWYPILTRMNGRVLVLDGFAGRGKYKDGEPGSPVIALNRLLKHSYWPRMSHREFVFLFIEHDEGNAATLRQSLVELRSEYEVETGPWPGNVKYEVRHGTFAENAMEICDYLESQKKRLAPTFAFVDPFGWTGMPMDLIARLLNHPSCEIFVNFMVNSVNRFLTHPQQVRNMNELFGKDVDQLVAEFSGGNRVEYLRDVYEEQLQEVAGFTYVRWFAMRNNTGNVGYYLLHGTRNTTGVEKMKDAMWKVAPSGDYSFSDRLAGVDVLFEPEPSLHPLRSALLAAFSGRRGLAAKPDLEQWVLLNTPYKKSHLRPVLRDLEESSDSPIIVHRPPGARQYGPGVTIDFN